jgi:hypothetical protein
MLCVVVNWILVEWCVHVLTERTVWCVASAGWGRVLPLSSLLIMRGTQGGRWHASEVDQPSSGLW